jgi:hypothetical protein
MVSSSVEIVIFAIYLLRRAPPGKGYAKFRGCTETRSRKPKKNAASLAWYRV